MSTLLHNEEGNFSIPRGCPVGFVSLESKIVHPLLNNCSFAGLRRHINGKRTVEG